MMMTFKCPYCRTEYEMKTARLSFQQRSYAWQALGCLHFDPNDARRQAWNGKWPGEDDCERLGLYRNGDADLPDLNRLFTDCVWDADTGGWERKQ
jgi:hypothetical protein